MVSPSRLSAKLKTRTGERLGGERVEGRRHQSFGPISPLLVTVPAVVRSEPL
jgi:hypothetical protein